MTVYEYFKDILDVSKKIAKYERDIASIDIQLKRIKSQAFGNSIRSTAPGGGIDYLLNRKIKKENDLKEKNQEYSKLRIEKENKISLIKNDLQQETLIYFYLDRLSIKEISDLIGLSESYTKKIKSNAINSLERILNDKKKCSSNK